MSIATEISPDRRGFRGEWVKVYTRSPRKGYCDMTIDWYDEIEAVSKLVEFSENNCAVGHHTLFRG